MAVEPWTTCTCIHTHVYVVSGSQSTSRDVLCLSNALLRSTCNTMDSVHVLYMLVERSV